MKQKIINILLTIFFITSITIGFSQSETATDTLPEEDTQEANITEEAEEAVAKEEANASDEKEGETEISEEEKELIEEKEVEEIETEIPANDELTGVTELPAGDETTSYLVENQKSVAVIQFGNMSRLKGYDYLGETISGTLFNTLSRQTNLELYPENETEKYLKTNQIEPLQLGDEVSVREIGKDLDVDVIIYGKYITSSDKISISAYAIDTNTAIVLSSYEGIVSYQDFFDMVDELSLDIKDKVLISIPTFFKEVAEKINVSISYRKTNQFDEAVQVLNQVEQTIKDSEYVSYLRSKELLEMATIERRRVEGARVQYAKNSFYNELKQKMNQAEELVVVKNAYQKGLSIYESLQENIKTSAYANKPLSNGYLALISKKIEETLKARENSIKNNPFIQKIKKNITETNTKIQTNTFQSLTTAVSMCKNMVDEINSSDYLKNENYTKILEELKSVIQNKKEQANSDLDDLREKFFQQISSDLDKANNLLKNYDYASIKTAQDLLNQKYEQIIDSPYKKSNRSKELISIIKGKLVSAEKIMEKLHQEYLSEIEIRLETAEEYQSKNYGRAKNNLDEAESMLVANPFGSSERSLQLEEELKKRRRVLNDIDRINNKYSFSLGINAFGFFQLNNEDFSVLGYTVAPGLEFDFSLNRDWGRILLGIEGYFALIKNYDKSIGIDSSTSIMAGGRLAYYTNFNDVFKIYLGGRGGAIFSETKYSAISGMSDESDIMPYVAPDLGFSFFFGTFASMSIGGMWQFQFLDKEISGKKYMMAINPYLAFNVWF